VTWLRRGRCWRSSRPERFIPKKERRRCTFPAPIIGGGAGFRCCRCDVKSFCADYHRMAEPDMNLSQPAPRRHANDWAALKSPLLRFLDACHADFSAETGGAVANYIPELGKADPNHFGISLATIDGYVYEVGDSRAPFTIQSMSKPFVFALALDTLGADHVESAIGVEPSGDPFNSIRLNADNHPFNPMVNAGAIACTGLIHQANR